MAKVDVVMPQLGESLTEGTIIKWHKKPGDKVKKDETLLEISTDKVDSEIPSPATGVVTKLLFDEQKTVEVRTVIAEIDTDESAAVPAPGAQQPVSPPKASEPAKPAQAAAAKPAPPAAPQAAPPAPSPEPAPAAGGRFYSPLVMNIAREEGIAMAELERIPGTGEGGRVSKKDILGYLEMRKKGTVPAAATPGAPAPAAQPAGPAAPRIESTLKHFDGSELSAKYPGPNYDILQMSNVLKRMSEHMVKSVQTAPHVWAVHECDMTNVDRARRKIGESFEKREGFKLTFMPFICDAVIRALKEFPLVNCSLEGDKIIMKKFINLGIAVASETGLIVPVIKNADEKNFTGLARAVNDLASRTRAKKLSPADIEGGTFTLTNYGVFGTMVGVPIINHPQVAILGTGAIEKRPVVINDAIAIRSIAYLTLAFDHRIVDGALGGSFMETVVKRLEKFDESQIV
ncbi:MAG TPA: dihydrolipoamide acetyltransferase family protein [Bacteroidota bacterium]|jgi:2-oxoglutarate dehydrogenase E2 component (dihydrolipoamide succinyltransferase)